MGFMATVLGSKMENRLTDAGMVHDHVRTIGVEESQGY
jgi:hypothetical protein